MKLKNFTLTHYSTLSTIFLLSARSEASAQIMYRDEDPDIILDITEVGAYLTHYIDINLDGLNDFLMVGVHNTYTGGFLSTYIDVNEFFIEAQGHNAIQESTNYGANSAVAVAYSIAKEVGSSMHFENGLGYDSDAYLASFDPNHNSYAIGDIYEWLGQDYKYAAFRLWIDSAHYYGWMRMSMDTFANVLMIHDMAWNSTPNTSILTGETGFCDAPIIYKTKNITATSAKICFAPVLNAAKYQIRYRPVGGSSWLNVNASASAISKNITGLSCNTTYEVRMRAKCGTENGPFSPITTFTTAACKLMNDQTPLTDISLYPVPADGTLVIDLNKMANTEVKIELYDIYGNAVHSGYYVAGASLNIDVSSLSAGNYILKANSEKFHAVKKVMIQ